MGLNSKDLVQSSDCLGCYTKKMRRSNDICIRSLLMWQWDKAKDYEIHNQAHTCVEETVEASPAYTGSLSSRHNDLQHVSMWWYKWKYMNATYPHSCSLRERGLQRINIAWSAITCIGPLHAYIVEMIIIHFKKTKAFCHVLNFPTEKSQPSIDLHINCWWEEINISLMRKETKSSILGKLI